MFNLAPVLAPGLLLFGESLIRDNATRHPRRRLYLACAPDPKPLNPRRPSLVTDLWHRSDFRKPLQRRSSFEAPLIFSGRLRAAH
jgi:hypothetical protein